MDLLRRCCSDWLSVYWGGPRTCDCCPLGLWHSRQAPPIWRHLWCQVCHRCRGGWGRRPEVAMVACVCVCVCVCDRDRERPEAVQCSCCLLLWLALQVPPRRSIWPQVELARAQPALPHMLLRQSCCMTHGSAGCSVPGVRAFLARSGCGASSCHLKGLSHWDVSDSVFSRAEGQEQLRCAAHAPCGCVRGRGVISWGTDRQQSPPFCWGVGVAYVYCSDAILIDRWTVSERGALILGDWWAAEPRLP
jgi:hypothetical protein